VARARTLRPGFFTSFTLAQVSRDCRLFFEGLWVEADDEGRLIDSPKRLAGAIFPHDDDVEAANADHWLNELVRIEAIVRYRADGGRYIVITGFAEHQKPPHAAPSKLPPPPDSVPPADSRDMQEDSRDTPEDSRDTPEDSGVSPEDSRLCLCLGLCSCSGLLLTGPAGESDAPPPGTSAVDPEPPPGFAGFWVAYPRKVGKPGATKAWKRIPPAEHPAVMAGLERWNRYWQAARTGSEHIPHPATWLNDCRWHDATPAARAGPAGSAVDPLDEYRRRHGLSAGVGE
jgi:hypothetical protein